MENENTLQKRTIQGMIWSFMDTAGTQVVQLIVHLILARLLTPEDFGIVGMVTIFIALSSVFVDSGFTNGLIREKETTQEDYSTIFYFNLLTALVFYFLLFISAEYISSFFGEPQLVAIIKVIGLVLIINAFGLIQRTMLTKKINFRTQMKINVLSSILSGVIAITCALRGWGVWSLVVRTLAMQAIQATLLCISNRWLPSLVFSITSFRRLFQFGWKLLLSNLISQLYNNLYSFIIGKGFSATALGYYSNAVKFSDTAAYSLSISVEKVSFPVLSSIQEDTERLKRGYKKIIKNAAYISFPVMLGLAAIAPPLFRTLLGESWIPSIPYFQVLCLSGLLIALQSINLSVLQVKGRSDLYLKLSLLRKISGFVAIGLVLFFRLGIMGLLWALVVDSCITYFINAAYSKRFLDYSIPEQLQDIKLFFIMSVLMAGLTYSLSYLLPLNDFLMVIIQVLVGIGSYILLSLLFKVEELKTIYQILQPVQDKILKRMAPTR